MTKRAPAFQFYANDWLSSTKVMLMTPAQEGAYLRLLLISWNDPDLSIPDDDQQLAILSRMGEGWLNGGSALVRSCFEQHPTKPGRLVNTRLVEEYEKQQEWREKSREGGKKSAQARKEAKNIKGGSSVVDECLTVASNHKPTLLSSSSSSSSSKEEGKPPAFSDEPSPIFTALENIYPGHATNFRTMSELFVLAEKLGATPAQVLNFPNWLETNYPKKAHSPFAFKDLFDRSLKNGNGNHSQQSLPAPKFNCNRCQDTTSVTVKAETGVRYVNCPECQSGENQ